MGATSSTSLFFWVLVSEVNYVSLQHVGVDDSQSWHQVQEIELFVGNAIVVDDSPKSCICVVFDTLNPSLVHVTFFCSVSMLLLACGIELVGGRAIISSTATIHFFNFEIWSMDNAPMLKLCNDFWRFSTSL